MKHLVIGIGILLLCLVLCLTVSAILGRYTDHVTGLLEETLDAGQNGDWDDAGEALDAAWEFWNGQRGFFGVALRHAEVDAVDGAFSQLRIHVRSGSEDFAATCADLIQQIRHLFRSELPSYYNILSYHLKNRLAESSASRFSFYSMGTSRHAPPRRTRHVRNPQERASSMASSKCPPMASQLWASLEKTMAPPKSWMAWRMAGPGYGAVR